MIIQDLAYRINGENLKYTFYIYNEHIQQYILLYLRIHCAMEMKIKSSLSMQYVLALEIGYLA